MSMNSNVLPGHWHIGHNVVSQSGASVKEIIDDPRGLLHVWEAPISHANYIMSLDPTMGITGWSRYNRIDGDHKIDNAAIEILRVNAIQNMVIDPQTDKPKIDKQTGRPEFVLCDLQVAEYFAPIDPVESARIANILGRIYQGAADLDHCELIYESWPGPGVLTTQELLRVGYTNLWEWEYIADNVAESSGRLGWRSNAQSQSLLWARAKRHMYSNRLKINSPWLLGECRDAILDPVRMRAVAASGVHDDLLQAVSMAMWAGHKWTYDVDTVPEKITTSITDWQRRAPDFGSDYQSTKDQWREMVDNWG